MVKKFLLLLFLFTSSAVWAQKDPRTRDRKEVNVHHYALQINPDFSSRSIQGSVKVLFELLNPVDSLFWDLSENLSLDSCSGEVRDFIRKGRQIVVPFQGKKKGVYILQFYYHGVVQIAKHPPWEGGFSWDIPNSRLAVSCQGDGASIWFPCKDDLSDEPDSMSLELIVPSQLQAIGNGRLHAISFDKNKSTWLWKVTQPINLYNITFYIGRYQKAVKPFISSQAGPQILEFWYYNETDSSKALQLLEEASEMLACFEEKVGTYAFWKDGYKLVQAPYWGMEHQSAIAYGNSFVHNPFGFDFILIHESGHEWFGNAVSVGDPDDEWIHESFTTYLESVFLECKGLKDSVLPYLKTQRKRIQAKEPMIGKPGQYNTHHDVDAYFKGAWMIHTFRQQLDSDSLFFSWIQGLQREFKFQPISTDQLLNFTSRFFKKDVKPFFSAYLNYAQLPLLEYVRNGEEISTLTLLSPEKDFRLKCKIGEKPIELINNKPYKWEGSLRWEDLKKFVSGILIELREKK